ncbi:MAG: sulfurtransferase TusA family protein [bacterium]
MAEEKDLENEKPDEILDVVGEVCPNTELMAEKKLSKMKAGQVLEVYTDHEAAIENSFPSMLNKLKYPYYVIKTGPRKYILKIRKTS